MGAQIIQSIISSETVFDDFQLHSESGKYLALGERSPGSSQTLRGSQIIYLIFMMRITLNFKFRPQPVNLTLTLISSD